MSKGMNGSPAAAQAAAAAADAAAIDAGEAAATHAFGGRPRPVDVWCTLDDGVVACAWDSNVVEGGGGCWCGVVVSGCGGGAFADEMEPKLVSDDEMGDS